MYPVEARFEALKKDVLVVPMKIIQILSVAEMQCSKTIRSAPNKMIRLYALILIDCSPHMDCLKICLQR